MIALNLMQNTSTLSPHYYLLKELSSHQLHVLIASANTQPDGETLLCINARKEILQKKGQCFNCLRAGHVVVEFAHPSIIV